MAGSVECMLLPLVASLAQRVLSAAAGSAVAPRRSAGGLTCWRVAVWRHLFLAVAVSVSVSVSVSSRAPACPAVLTSADVGVAVISCFVSSCLTLSLASTPVGPRSGTVAGLWLDLASPVAPSRLVECRLSAPRRASPVGDDVSGCCRGLAVHWDGGRLWLSLPLMLWVLLLVADR